MDKEIEYVLLKMEEIYYEKNPDIRIARGSCMRDEGLTCNCITGIAINYIGYLLFVCLDIVDCSINFMVNGIAGYLQVTYKEMPLMPVLLKDPDDSECYLHRMICVNERRDQKQARIAFRQYSGIEELNEKVRQAEDIMQIINKGKGIDYCYRLKFWIPFLSTLRVRSFEESSKAFLAMAIFMFPGKTLRYVCGTVKMTDETRISELRWVADFLDKYSAFLEELESVSKIFSFYEFSKKFKELTNIEIGYFMEDIINNPKVPGAEDALYEIFSMALSTNLREKNKRGMLYKTIEILNKRIYNGGQCSGGGCPVL